MNCGNTNEMNVTIAVESQFKQLRNSPKKKFFGASTGFRNPWPLRSRCSALPAELWRPIQWRPANLLSSSTRERNETQNEMMWTAMVPFISDLLTVPFICLMAFNSSTAFIFTIRISTVAFIYPIHFNSTIPFICLIAFIWRFNWLNA